MTKDMTAGRPLALIIRFALPIMAGAVLQQLCIIINMLTVGNALGSRAMAAVGVTDTAVFFSTTLALGLTTAFTIVIAQYFGAKDHQSVRKAFVSSLYVCVICAAGLAAAGLFGAEPLLKLLNTPEDIRHDAVLYLRIIVGGSAGLIVYNSAAAVLRAIGDSRTPLFFLLATSVLNILLALLFVLVFHLGVMGAALATVIAQILPAAACAAYLLKRYELFRLRKNDLTPDARTLGLILKIGLPIGFQSLLLAVGDMTITGTVNLHGTNVVFAYATGLRVMYLTVMCASMSLAQAFAVFAGQNLGARQIGRIQKGFREIVIITVVLCAAATAFVFLSDDLLVRMFVSDGDAHINELIVITRANLRITAVFYIFLGLIWLYNNTLRSLGDVAVPFASGLTELAVKIGMVLLLNFWFGYAGIWFVNPLAWVLGLIPPAIRYHTGGWRKRAERFTNAEGENAGV